MMKRYYWSGNSRLSRVEAISKISDCAIKFGTVLNFQPFSDLSLSLIVEVDQGKLLRFKDCIDELMDCGGIDAEMSNSDEITYVLLNIVFPKGKGDLTTVVPDVPG